LDKVEVMELKKGGVASALRGKMRSIVPLKDIE